MDIMVTGGCGYIGTPLVKMLTKKKFNVVIVDTQWFGNYHQENENLKIVKKDIRDLEIEDFKGVSKIIHVANIANDPAVKLNEKLSWEVNVLATQQMADLALRSGIEQFIYASSGSVYGIKEEQKVTEELELLPLSVYNKTKMVAERVLLSYQGFMPVHCIRPATVCGWSPRMRLDVSVNLLTLQALKNSQITVFGGQQTRPNIHIQDMVRVYQHFLTNPSLPSGCYNAGFENISILEIAELVREQISAQIVISESNDPRSYRQNSDKLQGTGFEPKYKVSDAVDEVIEKYQSGELDDSDQCYTVKWMKHLSLGSRL